MIEFVIFMLKQQDPSTPSLYQLKQTVLPGYTPPQLVGDGTSVYMYIAYSQETLDRVRGNPLSHLQLDVV